MGAKLMEDNRPMDGIEWLITMVVTGVVVVVGLALA